MYDDEWCLFFGAERMKDAISEEIPLVFHQFFYLLVVFICWALLN